VLKLLLAGILVYTTNQIHLPTELGVPGLNVINLVFLVTVFLVWGQGARGLPAPALRATLLFYFAAVVLGTVIATTARPMGLMPDLTYAKTLIFYPLYYLLFYYGVRSEREISLLLMVIAFVTVVAGFEAWLEARDYGLGVYAETRRAAGPFGPDYRSANRAAVFYVMFAPLLLATALLMRGRPLWRWAGFGGFLILVGAILFTYSRQGYLIGLLGALLVCWRRSVPAAVLGAVVFFSALPFLPEGASERVAETQQQGELGEAQVDESTESRWILWEGAWEMWKENPLGVGANRFKAMVGSYTIYSGKDAHNYYVLTLAELGLQGLLALLLLVFAMWRLARRLRRGADDWTGYALASGFSVSVLCMALGNIFGSPFSEGSVMGMFWALAALLERRQQLRDRAAAEAVSA
jgi:O-antigen ligase